MKRHRSLYGLAVLTLAALLAACGGKSTSLNVGVAPDPARVGASTCLNCHEATQDVTGTVVGAAWRATTHTTDAGVQCEDCHGGGGNHFGLGPIPFPNPQAERCQQCHGDKAGFAATRHGNQNGVPDPTFSQIPTAVPLGLHIEECSRCHQPNQRFAFTEGGVLRRPDPNNLPVPVVSCASCHDAHQTQKKVQIAQRADAVGYPLFPAFFTDNAGIIFQPNGAALPGNSAASVVGKNNELSVVRLCASCHARGTYKNSGGETHQDDIYTQWTGSGHGNRSMSAFALFSANPGAYNNAATGAPFTDTGHRTSYPFDMARNAAGATADLTRNAGNNNFACLKCHNGLASLAFLDNREGTAQAPVVFGDEPVTCITCHDPHPEGPAVADNVRRPTVMTRYDAGGLVFSGNVFLDNTPVPAVAGDSAICIFCHQGRESGFTIFKQRLASDNTLAGPFFDDHYVGAGARLWARNAYEYPGKLYGEHHAHQSANCIGCHMAPPADPARNDQGGHSWRIFGKADNTFNNTRCNAFECHGGIVSPPHGNTRQDLVDYRATFDTNDYDNNGVLEGIPREISGLQDQLIALLAANGVSYTDRKYPYFFTDNTFATTFTAWTLPTLKAAFNLHYIIKGEPSQATSRIGQPNISAADHSFPYNLQILRDSHDDLQARGVAGQRNRSGQPRPDGNRTRIQAGATNYDPQPGGGYNPRQ